jgi:hypothetical protein
MALPGRSAYVVDVRSGSLRVESWTLGSRLLLAIGGGANNILFYVYRKWNEDADILLYYHTAYKEIMNC